MFYLHGGYGNTFAKIEDVLDGQEVGYQVTIEIQPEDSFEARNEALLQTDLAPEKRTP